MTEKSLAALARAMDLLYNYLRVNFKYYAPPSKES